MKRLIPLTALALAACVTPGTSATPGLGQVGLVDGLRVRPLQVVEDSRCPINAICVWAGRLVVLTEVAYRGGSEEFRGNLTLGQPMSLGEETITLVSAAPSKLADTPIKPSDYRFTFSVAREP